MIDRIDPPASFGTREQGIVVTQYPDFYHNNAISPSSAVGDGTMQQAVVEFVVV
jgi:hypothetical protein